MNWTFFKEILSDDKNNNIVILQQNITLLYIFLFETFW